MDKFTFETDIGAYSATLISTIAAFLQDVPESDIYDLAVSDAPAARLAGPSTVQGAYRSGLRALQGSSAVDITYRVTTRSSYFARTLAAQLARAIETGDFTALLQQTAYANSASGLESASADSMSTDLHQGDSPADLSFGDIIGIAIAGLVVMLLIAWGVYYIWFRSKE